MNEELMQEIKSTLPWLLAAAAVVGGVYAFKGYRANQRAAASAAIVNSYTVDELQESVSRFGSSAAGGALRLRLAKKYFDMGRYQESLDVYEDLIGNPPEGFADVPVVGKAQCLEALGKFAEAEQQFSSFAEKNPKSFLALTARLGAARSQAQKGDLKGALAALAALKKSNESDEIAKARIEATEDCLKRAGLK